MTPELLDEIEEELRCATMDAKDNLHVAVEEHLYRLKALLEEAK